MGDAGVVVAHADVAPPHLGDDDDDDDDGEDYSSRCTSVSPCSCRRCPDSLDQLELREGLVHQYVPVQLDVVRHRGVGQLVQVSVAQLLQHPPHVVLPGA